jgi:hypothetical protein
MVVPYKESIGKTNRFSNGVLFHLTKFLETPVQKIGKHFPLPGNKVAMGFLLLKGI